MTVLVAMYINKTQLTERDWSLKLIKDFLGEPDDIKPLGRYAEEHRYWMPRVERIERIEDFKTAQEKYLKRRAVGRETAKKQAAQRIEAAKIIKIHVVKLQHDEILGEAIEHFNCRQRRRDWNDDNYWEFTPADENSDSRFLERITVNYIRHHLTSYDSRLIAQKGKIGGCDAVPIIRRRVFEAIAKVYPHLDGECDRQMIQRGLITEIEIENKNKSQYEQLELPFRSR